MMAMIHEPFKIILGIGISATRSDIRNCRPHDSRTFGNDRVQPRAEARGEGFSDGLWTDHVPDQPALIQQKGCRERNDRNIDRNILDCVSLN